jgi:hypothetical protein
VHAQGNSKVCELATVVSLIVVTSFESPINPTTNPNPSIVTLSRRQLVSEVGLDSEYQLDWIECIKRIEAKWSK